jgi:hypothetical protein
MSWLPDILLLILGVILGYHLPPYLNHWKRAIHRRLFRPTLLKPFFFEEETNASKRTSR